MKTESRLYLLGRIPVPFTKRELVYGKPEKIAQITSSIGVGMAEGMDERLEGEVFVRSLGQGKVMVETNASDEYKKEFGLPAVYEGEELAKVPAMGLVLKRRYFAS